MNGFDIRKKIFTNQQLQLKCIPFLFFSTGANKSQVIDAYSLSVQGFFKKPASVPALQNTIKKIVEYWQECIAPNEY